MKRVRSNGFTLIELLAVIIILGILMIVAIPSVTSYIISSRKSSYVANAKQYVSSMQLKMNNLDYVFTDPDTTYYVHINNLKLEKGGQSPFGEWVDAYVVLTYDGSKDKYDYYWVSVDSAGYRVDTTEADKITVDSVYSGTSGLLNNRMPIGPRSKVYIIDKDGNVSDTTQRVAVTKEEAKKCYNYILEGDNASIVYYDVSCGKDVVIPAIIDKHLVTRLYTYSFYNLGLNSVMIPDTVTTIDTEAFAYNKLTSVVLPQGLQSIGNQAFYSNNLPEIKIPNGLVTLGRGAFRYNKITDITIPDSVSSIGACAFCNNPIPNTEFLYAKNNGVTDYSTVRGYIGDISKLANKKFIIPDEVNGVKLKTISSTAFYNMGMTDFEVHIPETVTTIGSSAFAHNGLAKVNLPNGLKSIGSEAFYTNRLTDVNIPSSVTSLGEYAFNNNWVTNPEQMFIYKRVSGAIDYKTLYGYCGKNRNNVVIPEYSHGVQLKTIDSYAMAYLSMTGTVTIPNSVTKINILSFQYNALTGVNNGSTYQNNPIIYSRTASGIDYTSIMSYGGRNQNVVVPEGVKRIEAYAFYYSYSKTVSLPQSLQYIGNYGFHVCSLTTVTIPSSVTTIGSGAFYKQQYLNGYNRINKIVNKTGKAFNWKSIIGGYQESTFVTGTATHLYGDVEVTAE